MFQVKGCDLERRCLRSDAAPGLSSNSPFDALKVGVSHDEGVMCVVDSHEQPEAFSLGDDPWRCGANRSSLKRTALSASDRLRECGVCAYIRLRSRLTSESNDIKRHPHQDDRTFRLTLDSESGFARRELFDTTRFFGKQ